MLRRSTLISRVALTLGFLAVPVLASVPMSSILGGGENENAAFEMMNLDHEGLEAKAAELRRLIEADPGDEKLYYQLFLCASIRISKEFEDELTAAQQSGQVPDIAALQTRFLESSQAATAPIFDQWQKNLPESCQPLLIQAQMTQDTDDRRSILISATEKCPDDALVFSSYASILVLEGNLEGGGEMLEEFVESHPEDPKGYAALVQLLQYSGRQADGLAVISTWRDNLPDDLSAMQTELYYRGQQMSRSETAAAAALLLDREHTAPELLQTCQVLNELDLPLQTDDCLQRVLHQATDADRQIALQAFSNLIDSLKSQNAWDRLQRLAADLPPAVDSDQTRLGIAYALVEAERCAFANELIRDIDSTNPPEDVNPAHWKSALASIVTKCGDEAAGTSDMLEVIRTVELGEIRDLLYSTDLDTAQVEAVLLQRIEDGEEPAPVYEVLARVVSSNEAPEKRLAYLEAWVFEAPEDPEPLRELASALRQAGALESAIEVQREALRFSAGGGEFSYLTGALVAMLIEAEKYDEATDVANDLVAHEIHAAEGWRLLAEVAAASGRTDEAMDQWDRYLAENPANCFEVMDYLEMLRDGGQITKIDAILEACSTADDDNPIAAQWSDRQMAMLYAQLDLYEQALAPLERLLIEYPGNVSLWNEQGSALLHLGRWKEAEASYREAIRIAPRDEKAYEALAELYQMDERWPEIVDLLTPMVSEHSAVDVDLGRQLARAQTATGDLESASVGLERIVVERPKEFDAWFELAEVAAGLEQTDRAVAAYQRFLELTPSYDSEAGGSCRCRCDVVDMRREAEEALQVLESTFTAGDDGAPNHTG